MIVELTDKLTRYLTNNEFSFVFLIVSFLGGVLSSLSPCTLGMLPLIIGYVGGYENDDKIKTFIRLVSFVGGLAAVLSVIGIICALTGTVFASFGGERFVLVLASLILVLGLNLLGLIELNLSPLVKKIPKGNSASLFIYPFLVGSLFAFAASPCSTPILAGIMSFATLTKSALLAGLMLFCFSLGQGIVVVLAGVFTSFLKGIQRFSDVSEYLMKFSGILLIIAALLMYVKIFSRFYPFF